MAFVPAPNILQVEIRATKALQKIENRLYVNCLHEPTNADIDAVNAVVATVIATHWIVNLPSDITINSLFYRSLHTQNAIQREIPLTSNNVGQLITTPAPNQNTICISLRTSSAGRSARGRLYWLGLAESQYEVNQMVPADLTSIVAAVAQMRSQLAAADHPWTIVSFVSNKVPRPGGPVYFLVSSVLAVDGTLDSQRRRMPGRGT